MISLLALSIAFFVLTLLIAAALVVVLRRRFAAGHSVSQGGDVAGRIAPATTKEG